MVCAPHVTSVNGGKPLIGSNVCCIWILHTLFFFLIFRPLSPQFPYLLRDYSFFRLISYRMLYVHHGTHARMVVTPFVRSVLKPHAFSLFTWHSSVLLFMPSACLRSVRVLVFFLFLKRRLLTKLINLSLYFSRNVCVLVHSSGSPIFRFDKTFFPFRRVRAILLIYNHIPNPKHAVDFPHDIFAC